MKSYQDNRWPYAASGALAAVAGIAVGNLVAALVSPASSPVLAVGSAVIDATPTPVKEWAVATFGNADKPILVGSVSIATLLLAAAIGLVARRRLGVALVLLVVLTGLAGTAALLQPTAAPVDVLPGLAAAAVGVATLWWLVRLLSTAPAATADASPRTAGGPTTLGETASTAVTPGATPRRSFLLGAAGVTAGAAV
ncbi:MAG TPA: oxidoreductase, partial [Methylomirabilota bacterium]|nr:oxidoreductase [Methylomirabilota bacterium]